MAQKIQTLFIDDIDGGDAEGTVRFGLDGAEYEIDLSAKNAAELRFVYQKYIDVARRMAGINSRGRNRSRGGQPGGASLHPGINTDEVRQWAKASGLEVKDRGRIPGDIIIKFKAAGGAVVPPPAAESEAPAAQFREPQETPAPETAPKVPAARGGRKPSTAKATAAKATAAKE
jgi:hypothetical protein